MSQRHDAQFGTFHVTTNAAGRVPWCTWEGVPQVLIDNLCMTRNIQGAKVYAFCILPNHMHIIVRPGEKGLSAFMHSFKRNSSKDVCFTVSDRAGTEPALRDINVPINRSRGSVTPAVAPKKQKQIFPGWQNGFHDERIRDLRQRTTAMSYVQYNAWRHNPLGDPNDWLWSSLHFQHLLDPMEIWFV